MKGTSFSGLKVSWADMVRRESEDGERWEVDVRGASCQTQGTGLDHQIARRQEVLAADHRSGSDM